MLTVFIAEMMKMIKLFDCRNNKRYHSVIEQPNRTRHKNLTGHLALTAATHRHSSDRCGSMTVG